jgi:hypothetical protein
MRPSTILVSLLSATVAFGMAIPKTEGDIIIREPKDIFKVEHSDDKVEVETAEDIIIRSEEDKIIIRSPEARVVPPGEVEPFVPI